MTSPLPYRAPTLADAVRTMARGLAYQESCVAIDARDDAWDVLTHPLANAHHRVASRLCRIAREQFEEALLVGVDLSCAEVNAARLRARGEVLVRVIEIGVSGLNVERGVNEMRRLMDEDPRGSHDGPASWRWGSPMPAAAAR